MRPRWSLIWAKQIHQKIFGNRNSKHVQEDTAVLGERPMRDLLWHARDIVRHGEALCSMHTERHLQACDLRGTFCGILRLLSGSKWSILAGVTICTAQLLHWRKNSKSSGYARLSSPAHWVDPSGTSVEEVNIMHIPRCGLNTPDCWAAKTDLGLVQLSCCSTGRLKHKA